MFTISLVATLPLGQEISCENTVNRDGTEPGVYVHMTVGFGLVVEHRVTRLVGSVSAVAELFGSAQSCWLLPDAGDQEKPHM